MDIALNSFSLADDGALYDDCALAADTALADDDDCALAPVSLS